MSKFLSRLLIVTLALSPVIASAHTTVAIVDDQGDIDTEVQSECLVLTKDLRLRSRDATTGGEVSLLQDFLNLQGYLKTEPTGFFSLSTFTAVKAFQSDSKLKPTGFVSVLTRKAIQKVSCDGQVSQSSVTVSLKSNDTAYEAGDTIIFTTKVTGQNGTSLTPQDGVTVMLTQVNGANTINDEEPMTYDRRSGNYSLRSNHYTTSSDIGSWTAFAVAFKNGVKVGVSQKISYKIVSDQAQTTCTDSDGGIVPEAYGTTETRTQNGGFVDRSIDTCFASIDNSRQYPANCYDWTGTRGNGRCLIEAYCAAGAPASKIVECPNGCSNGACQKASETPVSVVYPNGGEVWTAGNDYSMRWTPSSSQVPSMTKIDEYVIDQYGNNAITPAIGRTNTGWDGWTPQNLNGKFKLKICQSGTTNCDMSDDYFTITSVSKNLPPVINGIQSPTSLKVGETGTWTINATDPENGPLKYRAIWGDEYAPSGTYKVLGSIAYSQNATFTHTYSEAGTYTPKFYVQDDIGQLQSVSATIVVKNAAPNYDACRLDALGGTNIVRDSINDRELCLSQLCDVVGLRSAEKGLSSKCVFMGQEIKRYEATVPAYSVSLLSPNGGQTWNIGSIYSISYTVSPRASQIRVYLERDYAPGSPQKGVNSSMQIATGDSQNGFSFTVPSSIMSWPGLGSGYRIKVCADTYMKNCDSSDGTFAISNAVAPELRATVRPIGTSDTAAVNQKNVNLLRVEARASGEDILLTSASFKAAVGSLLNLQNYAFWVDTDGNGNVDTIVQRGVSPSDDSVVFNMLVGGGYVVPSGKTVAFEVHADVASALQPDNRLRLRFVMPGEQPLVALQAQAVDDGTDIFRSITLDPTTPSKTWTFIGNANLPPVIDGLTAPTIVTAGQSTQWTIKAHDPENKSLTYAVVWGDEPVTKLLNGIAMAAPDSTFVQTTTFTHTYASAGTYTPTFYVKDDAGQVQSVGSSIRVLDPMESGSSN